LLEELDGIAVNVAERLHYEGKIKISLEKVLV